MPSACSPWNWKQQPHKMPGKPEGARGTQESQQDLYVPCVLHPCASVSHSPRPPPAAVPPLLHVGQQLAQEQSWGLYVHTQDLKSEERRVRRLNQPQTCLRETLGVPLCPREQTCIRERRISLLTEAMGVCSLLVAAQKGKLHGRPGNSTIDTHIAK